MFDREEMIVDMASKSSGDSDDNKSEDDVSAIPADDAHKTEKVTKLGRKDLDPDEASD